MKTRKQALERLNPIQTNGLQMTSDELTAIRQRLGLGPVAMARALGVSYSTYRDWASGRTRVHPAAAQCARLLCLVNYRVLARFLRK